MSAINETIVREYFELHGFLVRQQRKYLPRTQREDEEIDLFVYNPAPSGEPVSIPFIIESEHLSCISSAFVSIKAWHTDSFSPSIIKRLEPDIIRFVQKDIKNIKSVRRTTIDQISRLIVVPAITTNKEQRAKTIEMLKSLGITGVIQFRTILNDLIAHVQVNHNYQKSDVLQVLRILKAYDFFKEPQLTLFEIKKRRRRALYSLNEKPAEKYDPQQDNSG